MRLAEVWILPDVLFSDAEFRSLSEEEQWNRLKSVSRALASGDLSFLKTIPWVSFLNPDDAAEGGIH
jgi:hypothetical protein